MSRRLLGIDVGGTFTDLCYWDGASLRTAKTPSTPDDFLRGIAAGLDLLGIAGPPRDSAASHPPLDLVHGSTVATNALLERTGDRVAFVTTRGFEDLLAIGRQDRPELYALHVRRPPPLAARADCFGVIERIGAAGEVVTALDESSLDAVLTEIAARGIEAVAVCLLFGFLNPVHERIIAERAAARGLRCFIASDILPEFREFERASTTVVNAYVAGRMSCYLDRLKQAARARGIAGVRVMQSNGGQIGVSRAARHAARTILSGPAGGVVAAMHVARRLGLDRIITYDMGGTSTDVALCDGAVPVRNDTVIDGLPVGVPMLAIHTIGAGGGSIAAIDAGGALRVGPASAGADPGPACYGRSQLATVTDAHVVLGRVRAEHFMGGAMRIDAARSEAALAALGASMGCDAVTAARSVVSVCSANMEHALSVVSAGRGSDPADFWLMSFGGAGGLHACELAAGLGMAGVIVPARAGLLSAFGLMLSDIVLDFSASLPRPGGGIDLTGLRYAYGRLMDQAADAVTREGYDLDNTDCERLIDLRYAGQAYELTVPLESTTDLGRLTAPFHALHQKRYGFASTERAVEAVTARVRAAIPNDAVMHPHEIESARVPNGPPLIGHAPVWFDTRIDTPFVRRGALAVGECVAGPAVIVEDHATTVVGPQWRAVVDRDRHLRLMRGN